MEKKVAYEKYNREIGFHLVQGVKVEGHWWALRQFQLVNGKYTPAGCNWYCKEQIWSLLEEESEIVDSGEARIEKVGEYELLIARDELGLEYMV